MGISIQQYRSAIGLWNCRKLSTLSASPQSVKPDTDGCHPDLDCHTNGLAVRGPWKAHALLLGLLIITTLVMQPLTTDPITHHEATLKAEGSHTWLSVLPHSAAGIHQQCPRVVLCTGGLVQNPGPNTSQEHLLLTTTTTLPTSLHPLCLLMQLLSKQTHDMLLLIGGVEPHPGPTMEEINEARSSVIAEFVVKADSQAVKDVLRLYKPVMTHYQLQKAFEGTTMKLLVETTNFLGVPGSEKYSKPAIINKLITRIQSLFPDECSICSQEYVVKLDETVLLSCSICGQGIHPRCLAQKIGVAEADLATFTTEDIRMKVNPCGLQTLTYLCGPCHSTEIPSPEIGLKKQRVSNQQKEVKLQVKLPHLRSRNESEALIDLDSDAAADPPSSTSRIQAISDTHDADSETDQEETAIARPRRRSKPSMRSPGTRNDQNQVSHDREGNDRSKMKPICSFYRKGQCRYGISGKGCPRAHPPLCRKLMNNGNKSPRGCAKGKDCDRLHPKMCPSSINYAECLNDSCSLYHVKGTRRLNSRPHPQEQSSGNKQNASHKRNDRDLPAQPPPDTQDSFLEVLRVWKQELLDAVDQKIQEVRERPAPPIQMQYSHIPQPAPGHLIPSATLPAPVGYQLLRY